MSIGKDTADLAHSGAKDDKVALANPCKYGIISIENYRLQMGDFVSSEEDIIKKISYLEVFLRNIIRAQIEYCIKNPIKKKIDE